MPDRNCFADRFQKAIIRIKGHDAGDEDRLFFRQSFDQRIRHKLDHRQSVRPPCGCDDQVPTRRRLFPQKQAEQRELTMLERQVSFNFAKLGEQAA